MLNFTHKSSLQSWLSKLYWDWRYLVKTCSKSYYLRINSILLTIKDNTSSFMVFHPYVVCSKYYIWIFKQWLEKEAVVSLMLMSVCGIVVRKRIYRFRCGFLHLNASVLAFFSYVLSKSLQQTRASALVQNHEKHLVYVSLITRFTPE